MISTNPQPDRWFGPCPRTIEDEMFESIEARIRREAFEHLGKNNVRFIRVVSVREGICVNTILPAQADDILVVNTVGREYRIAKIAIGDSYFWGITDFNFKENSSIVSSISRSGTNNLSDYLSSLMDKGYSIYIRERDN